MIQAVSEPKTDDGFIYQTQTLLGKRDDPLLYIYARQIIERITTGTQDHRKPLLLAISLREEARDSQTFTDILNKLDEIKTW